MFETKWSWVSSGGSGARLLILCRSRPFLGADLKTWLHVLSKDSTLKITLVLFGGIKEKPKEERKSSKDSREKKEKKLLKQAGKAKPGPNHRCSGPQNWGCSSPGPCTPGGDRGWAPPKAQDDSEDEIPLLVPLKETPAAGSAKVFSLILVPVVDGFWGLCVPAGTAEGQECYTWEAAL